MGYGIRRGKSYGARKSFPFLLTKVRYLLRDLVNRRNCIPYMHIYICHEYIRILIPVYMGGLIQGFDGLCFERPARSRCQRAARARARAQRASIALDL